MYRYRSSSSVRRFRPRLELLEDRLTPTLPVASIVPLEPFGFLLGRSLSSGTLSVSLTVDPSTTLPAGGYSLTGSNVEVNGNALTVKFAAGASLAEIDFAPSGEAEAAGKIQLDLLHTLAYTVGGTGSAALTVAANGLLVTNTNATGDGSLAQAVANADSFTSGGTITFASGEGQVFSAPQTIQLSSTLNLVSTHAAAAITIDGPTAGVTVRGDSANLGEFVFTVGGNAPVDNKVPVALNDLTIAGGLGVYNGGGTLSLYNCTITGSSSNGILNGGYLLMEDCIVTDNSEGGIRNFSGSLSVRNCTITDNNSTAAGGGIANDGALSVQGSTISDNTSGADGGGISNSGTMIVTDSTIADNSAGGGDDTSGDNYSGGGIASGGIVTVQDSTIDDNHAIDGTSGGGIVVVAGQFTLVDATVSNNTAAKDGGGILANPLSNGGTVFLTATNVTFFNNTAVRDGGAIADVFGSHSGPTLNLTQCTITANTAGPGDVGGGGIANTGTLNLNNTIVYGNTAPKNPDMYTDMNNQVGAFGGNGFNITPSTPPQGPVIFAPLGYYGGPTETMPLLPERVGGSLIPDATVGAGFGVTALTTSITSSTTIIHVKNAAAIATIGSSTGILIEIDSEQMLVTGVDLTNNTLLVQRGYNGTHAAGHNPGAGVFIGTDQRGYLRPDGVNGPLPDLGAFQTEQFARDLIVTSTADPAAPPGESTLREAVNLANVEAQASGLDETVTFNLSPPLVFGGSSPVTITLTQGPIFINPTVGGVMIDGGGADINVTNNGEIAFIVGNGVTAAIEDLTLVNIDTTGISPVVNGGSFTLANDDFLNNAGSHGGAVNNTGTLTVSNDSFSGNSGSIQGGAIDNAGTLIVSTSTFADNSVGVGGLGGGAIMNEAASSLSVSDSTFSGNTAPGAVGGAIYNAGDLTASGATFNAVNSANTGGAIFNEGAATLYDSTLSDNTASFGAGLYNEGLVTISNSTISDNKAVIGTSDGLGGGLSNLSQMEVTDCTITGNTGLGAGIWNDFVEAKLVLSNTIVAGNPDATDPDLFDGFGSVSATFTMIGKAADSGVTASNGNILNPKVLGLGTLGSFGGATQTIPLLTGSPALKAGGPITTLTAGITANTPASTTISVADAAAIASTNPVNDSGFLIEIGSEQMLVTGISLANNTLTVTRGVNGTSEAKHNSGAGIVLITDQRGFSRPSTKPDIGAFQTQSAPLAVTTNADNTAAGAFTGGVSGQLTLRDAVDLAAALGGKDTVTFAAGTGQTFAVAQTIALATGLDLDDPGAGNAITIEGTPAGVTIAASGGSFSVVTVAANTTAELDDVTVSQGSTGDDGGGIENDGTLTLRGVTVAHNVAHNGGGIDNTGTLTITNSTIADNTAQDGDGGGIDNEAAAKLTITNSTIAGNTADDAGGGIFNAGTLTLNNTIVAHNNATTDPNIDGTFTGNNNMIGAAVLAALADNGGPTDTVSGTALGSGGAITQVAAGDNVGPSDTTITVTNTAAFAGPAANFFIRIDTEIMLVTAVTGNALTVERGWFGTTAASHNPGANVYLATDQRGVLRSTTAPDIGAFEADTKPLTVWLNASASTVEYGQPLTLTVAVTGPSGTPAGTVIILADSSATVGTIALSNGSGADTITVATTLAPGPHTLTAVYLPSNASGNATVSAAPSNAVSVTVSAADTTTTGVVTPADPAQNQSLTFTADVSPISPSEGTPTGDVQFQVDGNTPTDVALSGASAALVLPAGLSPGPHVLTATYLGDGNFNAGNPFTLNLAGSTITGALTPSAPQPGQPVSFTATVSAMAPATGTPTGLVEFQVGNNPPTEVALSDGQASLSFPDGLPAGAEVITATYLGDGNFNASATFTQQLPYYADLAVSGSASSASVLAGQSLTYTITVTNNGPQTATGVALVDTLADGVTLVSATYNQGTCAIGTGSVTLTLPSLADNASATLVLVVTPSADAGNSITDIASVSSTTTDPNLANNAASVQTAVSQPIVVTDTQDVGQQNDDSDDPTDTNGLVSLRSAIAAANDDAAAGISDTIVFAPALAGATLTLTEGFLELSGLPQTGSATITIDASAFSGGITVNGNQLSAVFKIDSRVHAVLDGLNIVGGASSFNGGGINNAGNLTVANCTIVGNTAADDGGGISNTGTLTVTGSTIGDNTAAPGAAITDATIGYGAGIYNNGGTVTLTGSTVSNNVGEDAGGIFNGGSMIVNACTISGNTAQDPHGGGGGLENGSGFLDVVGSTIVLVNTTVSANSASYGDGLWNNTSSMTLINCTVSGNAPGNGAGILNYATLVLQNTIVAGNASTTFADLWSPLGTVTANYCLIGVAGDSGISGGNGNILNPKILDLAPLGNYGGATQTIALLPGSPAIDAGSNSLAVDAAGNPLTTDQRGDSRIANGTVDIGAFEVE